MKNLVVIFLLLLANLELYADYLVTSRKTSVKKQPSSQSGAILQIESDTELQLLDAGIQTNGYYRVRSNLFSGDGWIYRTFVRRYASPWIEDPTDPAVSGNVEVRVVDVGPGLCNLIKLPDNRFVIYDAGHWRGNGNTTLQQIKDFIPEGSEIELMILSHTDSDHIGAADKVIRDYRVKKVLWTGYERSMTSSDSPSATYNRLVAELNNHPEIENINLHERDSTIIPGSKLKFGNVTLNFLCGFPEPPSSWGLTDRGEKINSVSIVMKLEYEGRSILFCGDAVGRHRGDPENALIGTEMFLINQASSHLRSTIVIAPHHGADNGSSAAFVNASRPESVIFSAGHDYNHPTASSVNRYLNFADINNIFRTDRGDDEREPGRPDLEWNHGRNTGCQDDYADDDIHIELHANGSYRVYYVNPNEPCGVNN